ncbi:hypothetical protein Syncc9605_2044 [Synechococcus sp. CC9605]|nr:hypothetical protein Syncc9605_2044 [Synechococcus sp. CC9605]
MACCIDARRIPVKVAFGVPAPYIQSDSLASWSMVGTREVVAGGAAPYRKGFIQLFGQHHVEAGLARRSAWMGGRTSLFFNASG